MRILFLQFRELVLGDHCHETGEIDACVQSDLSHDLQHMQQTAHDRVCFASVKIRFRKLVIPTYLPSLSSFIYGIENLTLSVHERPTGTATDVPEVSMIDRVLPLVWSRDDYARHPNVDTLR